MVKAWPVGAFDVFLWLKIWRIKIFCLFLPVVITNHVMRWRSIVDETMVYPIYKNGVTLRSGERDDGKYEVV